MSLLALDYLKTSVFSRVDDPEARVLLFCLFGYADDHGRRMFPGVARLAAECRREPAVITALLDDLLTRDVIRRDPRRPGLEAFLTTVDLSLWKSCGKPVDELLTLNNLNNFSDPSVQRSVSTRDPSVQMIRQAAQQTVLREDIQRHLRAVLLEAEASRRMLKTELPSRGLKTPRRRGIR